MLSKAIVDYKSDRAESVESYIDICTCPHRTEKCRIERHSEASRRDGVTVSRRTPARPRREPEDRDGRRARGECPTSDVDDDRTKRARCIEGAPRQTVRETWNKV